MTNGTAAPAQTAGETTEELDDAQRLELAELALGQVFEGLEHAASAINRSEVFLFALIKVLILKGALTLEEVDDARELLSSFDDLGEYWTGKKSEVNTSEG